MIAAIAAAAALAAPVIGSAPGVKGQTFLHPDSLTPVSGAARIPDYYTTPALSPDAKRVVIATPTRLRFYSSRRGKQVGSAASVAGDPHWLTDDRIIAVQPGRNHSAVVIDAATRKVIRKVPIDGRIGTVAQDGDRLLLLVAPKRGGEQSLVVLTADGDVERTVALPGLHGGHLHPASPDGRAYAIGSGVVFAVDLETGDVTRRDNPGDGVWVPPSVPGALAYYDFTKLHILDPKTLETVKTLPVDGDFPVGAGPGFTSLAREEGDGVTVYDASGNVVWHRARPTDGLGIGAIGDRLFVATGYSDVEVRVYDLATGKLLRHLKGRYEADVVGGAGFSNAANGED